MQVRFHFYFFIFSLCPLFPHACQPTVSLLNCSLLQLLHMTLSLLKSVAKALNHSSVLQKHTAPELWGCRYAVTNYNSCPKQRCPSHFLQNLWHSAALHQHQAGCGCILAAEKPGTNWSKVVPVPALPKGLANAASCWPRAALKQRVPHSPCKQRECFLFEHRFSMLFTAL